MILQDTLFLIGTFCVIGVVILCKLRNKKYQKHKDILWVVGFLCMLPSITFSIYSVIGILSGFIIAYFNN